MRKQIIFLILSIKFAMLSTAQDFFFTHYQAFDEKSGYKVFEGPYSLTQDKKGLLWIGSDNGLISFDGTHFRNYRHRNEDSLSLPGNLTLFNFQDSKGKYWTAVSGHGLFNFNPITEKFSRFKYNNQKEFDIHHHNISPPIETRQGELWFALPDFGIASYNRKQNIIIPYKICPSNNCGTYYSASWVTFITEDPTNNSLWLATNNGLIHFFPATGKFELFMEKKSFSNLYTTLFFDSHKQLWLGTWGAGLKKFDVNTQKFTQYKWFEGVAGTKNICRGIGQYDENQLWVGTLDKGLLVFDATTQHFRSVRGNSNRADSLIVVQMMQNSKGVLWLATESNIVRLNPAENYFTFHSLENTLRQTTSAHSAFSFVRHDNTVYAGIYYEGYLVEYDLLTRRQKMYSLPAHKAGKGIFCLSKDAQNNIWIGAVSGTYIFNPKTKNFTHPEGLEGAPSFFRFPTYFILHDVDETFWLATQKGLIHFDPKEKKAQLFSYDSAGNQQLKRSMHDRIYSLFKDTKGNIWFGNNGLGLACYQRSTGRIYYFNKSRNNKYPEGNCESITEAKDGSILFTLGNTGLCILKHSFTSNETIVVLNSSNGLPSDYISNVFKDKKDNYWLFTTNGLCWFDPETLQSFNFSKGEGLAESKLYSTPYQDDEGYIYIGFTTGFEVFHPDRLLQSQTDVGPPHLALLKINGKEWPVNPKYLLSLSLNHTQSNIAFDFAAVSSQQTTGLQYAYKLDGLEEDWNYVGTKTGGQYNNLAPGKYRLRLKVANRFDKWSQKEWLLPVIIHPPWYGSRWFYAFVAVFSAALLYSLYRYRIGKILELQRMRTQIASDLHDDIGSTLTSISFYSEMIKMQLQDTDTTLKKLLDKIGSNARNAVNAMSDSVWMINPNNDITQNLMTRMKNHALEICGERNIECNFETVELRQKKLDMLQRKNIYLIYKEALHNAIKYSGCNSIRIRFLQTDTELKVSVEDNGKGFDLVKVDGYGNGLDNMKRRAGEIKASFAVKTAPKKGTSVILHLKVT